MMRLYTIARNFSTVFKALNTQNNQKYLVLIKYKEKDIFTFMGSDGLFYDWRFVVEEPLGEMFEDNWLVVEVGRNSSLIPKFEKLIYNVSNKEWLI